MSESAAASATLQAKLIVCAQMLLYKVNSLRKAINRLSATARLFMKHRYDQFNPKRRFKNIETGDLESFKLLAKRVGYGGNPEHKRSPGDFGLTPPSDARLGKSLCDDVAIFSRRAALRLLRAGLCRGLVSDRFDGDWPKNVWSVSEDGKPLEAQLENPVLGTYHGYPMPASDPFASGVLERWAAANV